MSINSTSLQSWRKQVRFYLHDPPVGESAAAHTSPLCYKKPLRLSRLYKTPQQFYVACLKCILNAGSTAGAANRICERAKDSMTQHALQTALIHASGAQYILCSLRKAPELFYLTQLSVQMTYTPMNMRKIEKRGPPRSYLFAGLFANR